MFRVRNDDYEFQGTSHSLFLLNHLGEGSMGIVTVEKSAGPDTEKQVEKNVRARRRKTSRTNELCAATGSKRSTSAVYKSPAGARYFGGARFV